MVQFSSFKMIRLHFTGIQYVFNCYSNQYECLSSKYMNFKMESLT